MKHILLIISITYFFVCCSTHVEDKNVTRSNDSLIVSESIAHHEPEQIDTSLKLLITANEYSEMQKKSYEDEVDSMFNNVCTLNKECKKHFINEKKTWERYKAAVENTISFGRYYYSAYPIYYDDVVRQAIELRDSSIHQYYNFLSKNSNKIDYNQLVVTKQMIDDAYELYIANLNIFDEYDDYKLKSVQKKLKIEQQCWWEWMNTRSNVIKNLSSKQRAIYKYCTQQTMRLKLIQLKNQNQGLGVTTREVLEVIIGNDCSDKELIEYPGFNVVWAQKYSIGE